MSRKESNLPIIKADDYKCFKCGKYLQALHKLQQATTALERMELKHKIDKTIVTIPGKLYRCRRKCT